VEAVLIILFLILAIVLLGASYWRGALIGPGLALVVVAVYLVPQLT
jgi:hypothetical protein